MNTDQKQDYEQENVDNIQPHTITRPQKKIKQHIQKPDLIRWIGIKYKKKKREQF